MLREKIFCGFFKIKSTVFWNILNTENVRESRNRETEQEMEKENERMKERPVYVPMFHQYCVFRKLTDKLDY